MARALVIAHDHLSSAGLLTAGIDAAGFAVDEVLVVSSDRFAAPDVTITFPDARDYDLVVPLGAPWSVYDADTLGPWVQREQQLLRDADAHGVPVLGVCFGGQQLAAAHGGVVAQGAEPEIGWVAVDTDEPELIEAGPWFEWHFDAWTPPPGARTVARTSRAPQAFVLRRNLAVQFHPEVEEKILVGWLGNGGFDALQARGIDADELIARTVAERPDAEQRATRLVTRFLDQVAGA